MESSKFVCTSSSSVCSAPKWFAIVLSLSRRSALCSLHYLFGFYYEFEPRSLRYNYYRHHNDIASQMHH